MVKCKILYLSLLTLLLLSNPATLSGQSAGENYINHKQMLSSDGTRYVTTVNYFDGIGRMSQTSSNGLSPTGGVRQQGKCRQRVAPGHCRCHAKICWRG